MIPRPGEDPSFDWKGSPRENYLLPASCCHPLLGGAAQDPLRHLAKKVLEKAALDLLQGPGLFRACHALSSPCTWGIFAAGQSLRRKQRRNGDKLSLTPSLGSTLLLPHTMVDRRERR